MKFKILIPVYNDWQSISKLLEDINLNVSNLVTRIVEQLQHWKFEISNYEIIISKANDIYENVERISTKKWQMPKEMSRFKNELLLLRDKDIINFEEKYGWLLWYSTKQ